MKHISLSRKCVTYRLNTSFDKKRVIVMYSDILSERILQILDKENLSYEAAAELCDISARHLSNIIRRCSVASVTTLEKLCSGLDATPNELLLSEPPNDGKA